MDLRLRELTLKRLLSLLAWTLLVILQRGILLLIESYERRIFLRAESPLEAGIEGRSGKATMLPSLSDDIVMSHVWPHLHEGVNISLLWRLRRVSRAWKRRVGATREWAALEMVRLDSPGLIRYLSARCEARPSLRDAVACELRSINFLLAECLEDFSAQSEVGSAEIPADEEFGRESASASSASSASDPGFLFLMSAYPRRGIDTLRNDGYGSCAD